MISIFESSAEVKQFGIEFTMLPDVILGLSHNLTIEHRETSVVQVSWDMETVLSTIDTNWEVDLEVESDRFLGSLSATEFSIAHLVHVVDVLFTVALTRLLVQLSEEVVHVINRFLVKLDSLDEDLGVFQWVSSDVMGLLSLLLRFLSLGLVLVNLASLVGSPDDHVANDFSGM
jgi:hypothetical protein